MRGVHAGVWEFLLTRASFEGLRIALSVDRASRHGTHMWL